MKCEAFDKLFDEGRKTAPQALEDHLRDCPACRRRREDYGLLGDAAARLKMPLGAGGLWQRIEPALALAALRRRRARIVSRVLALSAAAAVLFAAAAAFFSIAGAGAPSVILNAEEAASWEDEQARLEADLRRVEPLFHDRLAEANGERPLLSGQLEYIDDNIASCRRAMQANELNRAVRGSLIESYRKKLEIMDRYLDRTSDM